MREVLLASPSPTSGIFKVSSLAGRLVTLTSSSLGGEPQRCIVCQLDGSACLVPQDVVRLSEGLNRVIVAYRAADTHHTLFVTNQCNSRCLMCSQPPTRQDDSWLFREAMETISLIECPPRVVGVTGGEPTLHAAKLRELLDFAHASWPATTVEVLTNARQLGEAGVAAALLEGLRPGRTTWLVPLYGGADELHDFVVQAPCAFDQTVGGLLNLQAHGQSIQVRTVLIQPVLDQLPALCEFIAKNLPFVQTVALMGTEPIGFALANAEMCLVDPSERVDEIRAAVATLRLHGLTPVLMNLPLCKLPAQLRPFAAASISDWKNEFAPECELCQLKPRCSGFFTWDKSSFHRTRITPILRAEHV